MLRFRFQNRRILLSVCAFVGMVAVAGLVSAAWDAFRANAGYIRDVERGAGVNDLMDDIDVSSWSFTVRTPKGQDAVIKFIVRDETGRLDRNLSWASVFHYETGEPPECTIRTTRIDPAAFIERDTKKVKWKTTCRYNGRSSSSGTQRSTWMPRPAAEKNVGVHFSGVQPVENAIANQKYKVWETKVTRDSQDSSREDHILFCAEMWVTFVNAKPKSPNSSRLESLPPTDLVER